MSTAVQTRKIRWGSGGGTPEEILNLNAAVTFKSYNKNLIRLDFSLFYMRRDHDHTATLI